MRLRLLIACGVVLLAGCEKKIPQQRPYLGSWVHLTGTSMLPTIPTPSWVQFQRIPFGSLKMGDVVVFWHTGQKEFVLHRLDHMENGHWVSKGDNNPRQDTGIVSSDVYEGKYVGWAQNPS